MIQLQHISKTFKNRETVVEAVKDVSLEIDKGDIFGIIGYSGAGKSTLVRCINYLEKPSSGNVIFEGVDLGSLSHKELLKKRQSMSMIFQGFNLLSQRTALKNIRYPLEIAGVHSRQATKKAGELLELVGLSDREKAYPSQLSGGQKQRVAIARALATNPDVLLCDEATSALDPNTTRSILELLKTINQKLNVTIVIITHEMKVVEQICNKVAVMDQGSVVEKGEVSQVFLLPQSKTAREMIFPKREVTSFSEGKGIIRVAFDGQSAFEPFISRLSISCNAAVNILEANTKNVDGKAFGQMLIQLPDDENAIEKIKNYLDLNKITFTKVGADDVQ